MKQPIVPVAFYPTKIICVDDDKKYLDTLNLLIDTKKFSPAFFNNPLECLNFLHVYNYKPFTTRCIARPEEVFIDHRSIDINIRKIWREVYSAKRFTEVSVIVVDYAMPGLNGLDFCGECRLLKNSNFKLLMLTGEADEARAIQAFNDGLIDKFIRKGAPNFEVTLNAAIQDLQKSYFEELSQIIIDSLTKDPDHPMITWLDEPVFFKLFADICQKQDVIEYYLTDAFGSYMFLDFEGNPSWLIVKAADEMEAAFQAAEGTEKLPADILKSMQEYKSILYVHEKGGLSDDPAEIQASLHPATKLQGNRGTYYYSFVANPEAYILDKKMLLSYKDYREQLFK